MSSERYDVNNLLQARAVVAALKYGNVEGWSLAQFLLPRERARLRRIAGCHVYDHGCPIVIVEGDIPPTVRGTSYHWRNRRGEIVRYPGAYSRRFGRPIYVASTRHVVVGIGWLNAHMDAWHSKNANDATVPSTESVKDASDVQ